MYYIVTFHKIQGQVVEILKNNKIQVSVQNQKGSRVGESSFAYQEGCFLQQVEFVMDLTGLSKISTGEDLDKRPFPQTHRNGKVDCSGNNERTIFQCALYIHEEKQYLKFWKVLKANPRMLICLFATESHIWEPEKNDICSKSIAILKEI